MASFIGGITMITGLHRPDLEITVVRPPSRETSPSPPPQMEVANLSEPFIPGVIQESGDGKEAPQNFRSERATIAGWQGASENENCGVKPTPPEPILESRAVY